MDGHLKLTDFGLAGSMVKHRKKNQKANGESSYPENGLPLDQNLIDTMSKGKQANEEEPTLSTEDMLIVSSDSESSSSEDSEISNVEHYANTSNSRNESEKGNF